MIRSSLLLASTFLLVGPSVAVADDWPQWLGPKRDGVWRESDIVSKFPEGGPKVLWRQPVGAGYAGPAVADGRVFVTDRVLSRDARNPDSPFARSAVAGNERVICFDEKSGEELWKIDYPRAYRISYAAGPRCSPTVDGDRVYTLGAMGDLYCLAVSDGKVIWKADLMKDYGASLPVWGFAAHPLIDGDKLIVMAGGSQSRGVIAFDKMNGKVKWASQNLAEDFGYCPPMIFEVGEKRQLIIWHSEAIVGLDPESGERLWRVPFEIRSSLTAPTPRYDAGRLFVTSFYNGPMMLKLAQDEPGAEILWRGNSNSEQPNRTDKLHSIMPTPWFEGNHIYGVCSYGELRHLRADTGERVWMTREPTTGEPVRWGNAFLIKYQDEGDTFFLFNEKGELIIAELTSEKYKEIDRAKVIEPTNKMASGRPAVVWVHPAFANKCMLVRNDKEIIRISLEAE